MGTRDEIEELRLGLVKTKRTLRRIHLGELVCLLTALAGLIGYVVALLQLDWWLSHSICLSSFVRTVLYLLGPTVVSPLVAVWHHFASGFEIRSRDLYYDMHGLEKQISMLEALEVAAKAALDNPIHGLSLAEEASVEEGALSVLNEEAGALSVDG